MWSSKCGAEVWGLGLGVQEFGQFGFRVKGAVCFGVWREQGLCNPKCSRIESRCLEHAAKRHSLRAPGLLLRKLISLNILWVDSDCR